MSTDLTMLVLSAVLTLALALPSVVALLSLKGVGAAAGNRDEDFELPAWSGRASRAHRNMLENLPVFTALVLVTHLSGLSNETTALGATIFFWGRVVHAGAYIAGIPYLRTLAFGVSFAGMIVIGQVLI